jgi:hypothetical protein
MDNIYENYPLSNCDDSTNIRVIEIVDQDKASFRDLIECKFQIVSLKNSPMFTALSYTWGPPDAGHLIKINGQDVMIRKNLWEFLKQTLEHGSSRPRWLWIDAVCIDQLSSIEKSHQVAMMGEIYSRAANVLVWLGCGTKAISFALGQIQCADPKSRASCARSLDHEIDRGIEELEALEYWQRLWILQEYILATRIEIWCGTYITNDTELRSLLFCQTFRSGIYDSPPMKIFQHRSARLAGAKPHTLPDLIHRFGLDMKCENALDSVYAFLSLLENDERLCLDVRPDYSKTSVELFEDLVLSYHYLQDKTMGPLSLEENIDNLAIALRLDDIDWKMKLYGSVIPTGS